MTSLATGYSESVRAATHLSTRSFLPDLEGEAVVAQELVVVYGLAAEEPLDILSRGCSVTFAIEPLQIDQGIGVSLRDSSGEQRLLQLLGRQVDEADLAVEQVGEHLGDLRVGQRFRPGQGVGSTDVAVFRQNFCSQCCDIADVDVADLAVAPRCYKKHSAH